ncbi:hypothetical protein E4U54_008691 [Claviceps lovelessii]|nr:hypothetical protein E4U54_008691 [Claviceps lovelessii]
MASKTYALMHFHEPFYMRRWWECNTVGLPYSTSIIDPVKGQDTLDSTRDSPSSLHRNHFTRRVRGTGSHLGDFARFSKRPGTARVAELLPPRDKTPRTASAFGSPKARLADIGKV